MSLLKTGQFMEEITKHTLKIYKTIRNPTASASKKIVDIALEIFIIVFAVSLAQYLERQREQGVKQKEVKEFLLGLRNDMRSDVGLAKDNIQFYHDRKHIYSFLSNIKATSRPNEDTLKKDVMEIGINTYLRPRISRFEGFKSSGKLEEIEDKALLQNILYFYEQSLPQLGSSESAWVGMQQKLAAFFMENRVENDNGTNNYYELIIQPKAKNLCKALVPWQQIYDRYKNITETADTIVKEINKDYPENKTGYGLLTGFLSLKKISISCLIKLYPSVS